MSDVGRFTQIIMKFKTQEQFVQIFVNLMKIGINDKISWSDKEQPVHIQLWNYLFKHKITGRRISKKKFHLKYII